MIEIVESWSTNYFDEPIYVHCTKDYCHEPIYVHCTKGHCTVTRLTM